MQRCSKAEAARLLGINKATVTRWCQSHPALVDEAGTVDPEELRRHRDATIDPRLQTKTAAPRTQPGTLNDHKTRRERATADDAELELAKKLRLTVERRKVEAALAEAKEILAQALAQQLRDQAEALARIEDAREMEQAVARMHRAALAAFASRLDEIVSEEAEADAA